MRFYLHLALLIALGVAALVGCELTQAALDHPADPNALPGISAPDVEGDGTDNGDILQAIVYTLLTVGLGYLGKRYGLPLVRKPR